ncbi:MAG: NHL repeat-containing protein [Eubacteriales bacterium]
MLGAKSIRIQRSVIFILFVFFIFLFSPVSAFAKTNIKEISFNLPKNALQRPTAAAETADGKVYACDAAKGYIAVFDTDNAPLFTFSENLSLPIDIALSNTNVFVLDETTHSVIVYDYDGEYTGTLGTQGISAGQFYLPSALIIDQGILYVADTGNNRIQLFDAETLDLLDIFAIEENGTDLDTPSALAVLGDALYVVEANGAEVNTYHKSSGERMDITLTRSTERNVDITVINGEIALSSPANKQIDYYDTNLTHQRSLPLPKRIYGLSTTPSGHLLACGSTSRTADGLLYRIASDTSISTIPGNSVSLNTPQALATDDAGNFYVADTGNHRVLIFNSNLKLIDTITDILDPVDLQCLDDYLYVLDAATPALLIYDTSGTLTQSVSLEFTTNPHALTLINQTSALICGSSDLYFVDFYAPEPVFQTLNRDLIDSPQDVTIFGEYIYLLNNPQGDILYMPLSGETAYSAPLSAISSAPADATSLAITEDGTLYIADKSGNLFFCYDLSFELDQKIATDDFGFKGPRRLYASGEKLYICFSATNTFAELTHPVTTGDYYITLDDKKVDQFDKSVSVYTENRDADIDYVDIDYVASSGYTVEGNIGRYLLFYGLNTYDITVSDGKTKSTYTFYITRNFPDWFSVDDLDDYHTYTKTKDDEQPLPEVVESSEQTLLLDINGLNMEGLKITSFSKDAVATVEGTKVRIVFDSNDSDDPPIIQLAAGDGLVTLSTDALNQMITQMRNQYILYAAFAGIAVILLVYFFLEYLKKHPGKRNYKRIKK